MSTTIAALQVAQRDVQSKLGRCMLRLQQYERLLKTLLPNMALAGSPATIVDERERQAVSLRDRTLGQLVRQFINEHLVAARTDDKDDHDGAERDDAAGGLWMNIRYSVVLPDAARDDMCATLEQFVKLRNDLVHCFIDRFDIYDENECRDASRYLDSSDEQIESGFQRLKDWAVGFDTIQQKLMSFVQSEVFQNEFLHGVGADGAIDWNGSTVVEALRSAEISCQIDGWASLDAAIRIIGKNNRAEVPKRYGCKSWRQLLRRSGQFETKHVPASDGPGGRILYRSRTPG